MAPNLSVSLTTCERCLRVLLLFWIRRQITASAETMCHAQRGVSLLRDRLYSRKTPNGSQLIAGIKPSNEVVGVLRS